jgi:hypothetical protein
MSLVAGVLRVHRSDPGFHGCAATALAALRLAPIAARPVGHAILIPFTMLGLSLAFALPPCRAERVALLTRERETLPPARCAMHHERRRRDNQNNFSNRSSKAAFYHIIVM